MQYHYVLIRADLTPGQTAAQLVHAAGESARLAVDLPPNTHAVVLQVPTEVELTHYGNVLARAGIRFCAIIEPDMGNSLTAIGIEPQPRNRLRKLLSNLPLLK